MKLSLNWLQEYIDLPEDPHALGELITMHIAEVEEVIDLSSEYKKIVVGKITELTAHPDADKLRVCQVDIGADQPVQIVCGGINLATDQHVVVALPGSKVRWHGEGDLVELAETKIRGEASFGMICGADEVGLLDRFPKESEAEIVDLDGIDVTPGTNIADALQLNDVVIEIDNKTLTHRADLFNHIGFARELSVVLNRPLTIPKLPAITAPDTTDTLAVTIEDAAICNRYMGVKLNTITVGDSPQWMQQRLQAIGVAVINNVVDITNYVMYEFGQPLHAFDHAKLADGSITVRFSKPGEQLHTLDDKEREFSETRVPVIADANQPVALAGMMGGKNSEVDTATTSIILESANFNPITIRQGAHHEGVRTDGSTRHEKKLGVVFPELGLQRAVQLLMEHAGATVASAVIDTGTLTADTMPAEVRIEGISISNDIERLVGTHISKEEVERILTGLGLTIEFADDDIFTVAVPRTRTDLTIKEDIIEELARMRGYDNIEPEPLLGELTAPTIQTDFALGSSIVGLMTNWGAREIMNYSFYGEADLEQIGEQPDQHISVLNPMNPQQKYMRQTPIPHVLQAVVFNQRNRFREFTMVEYGHLYFTGTEFNTITIAVSGAADDVFFKLKGYVEAVLSELGVDATYQGLSPEDERENHNYQLFDPAADGVYLVNDDNTAETQLATVGIVKQSISEAADVEGLVAVGIIHLPRLADAIASTNMFQPISKYPSIDLDISIEVSSNVSWQSVEECITETTKQLIKRVELFDVYTGEHVTSGNKALGIRMWFQSMERTLEMSEAEQARADIITALTSTLKAKHRI